MGKTFRRHGGRRGKEGCLQEESENEGLAEEAASASEMFSMCLRCSSFLAVFSG